jgi:protein-disulfide isomerase
MNKRRHRTDEEVVMAVETGKTDPATPIVLDEGEQVQAARLAVPVSAADHIWGRGDAAVTLVEYGEFECPDCGRAHFQLVALRQHLDELDARFVFRHLARDEIHPFSVRAAVTAEAAGVQGRFWEMHDYLFAHQHSLEYEELGRHAADIGLDVERFQKDVRDPRLLEVVKAQGEGALRSGVHSTPTFFLNGRTYEGSHRLNPMIDAIREEASLRTAGS